MAFESSISKSPVLFFHITWLLAVLAGAVIADISEVAPKQGTDMLSAAVTTKPGCQRKCGDLTIPYPFGIGPSCSLNQFYTLTCNSTFDPPKAFLIGTQIANFSEIPRSIHEILDISETQFHVRNMVLHNCFNPENITKSKEQGMLLPPDSPFAFSATSNKIIAVGCGFYTKFRERDNSSIDLCSSYCTTKDDVAAGECSGSNGCKVDVFRSVVKEFYFIVARPLADSNSYNPCGYGFMGDATAFKFQGLSDFQDHKVFTERTLETVPLVVDWVIAGQTCKEARKNNDSYACQENTSCKDTSSGITGYHCQCRSGYDGNPYLPPGCTG
ncbi:wall-associated receptor kinase 2-like [Silene latifolia]|uniref:wall-associated receptor kinase 2-like n=1 Tax=Silene latifolia TaxID=37657 RepID=UPI003D780064